MGQQVEIEHLLISTCSKVSKNMKHKFFPPSTRFILLPTLFQAGPPIVVVAFNGMSQDHLQGIKFDIFFTKCKLHTLIYHICKFQARQLCVKARLRASLGLSTLLPPMVSLLSVPATAFLARATSPADTPPITQRMTRGASLKRLS